MTTMQEGVMSTESDRMDDRIDQEIERYGQQADMRGVASYGSGAVYGRIIRKPVPEAIRRLRPSVYERTPRERRIDGRASDEQIRRTIEAILTYIAWSTEGVPGKQVVEALRGRAPQNAIHESFSIAVRDEMIEHLPSLAKITKWKISERGEWALVSLASL